jgi:hypothetical protein
MKASGEIHAPVDLPQVKSPQRPLNTRLGGLQCRYGRCGEEKTRTLAEDRSPTVRLVARRYTDSRKNLKKKAWDETVRQIMWEHSEGYIKDVSKTALQL